MIIVNAKLERAIKFKTMDSRHKHENSPIEKLAASPVLKAIDRTKAGDDGISRMWVKNRKFNAYIR